MWFEDIMLLTGIFIVFSVSHTVATYTSGTRNLRLKPATTSEEIFATQEENQGLLLEYEQLHARESLTCGRSLMFVCGSKANCGGVGDRLTGMISILMVVILSDRVFLAHHNGLEYVFQPERLTWR